MKFQGPFYSEREYIQKYLKITIIWGLFAEKFRFNQNLEYSKLDRVKYKIFLLWCIRDLVQV